MQATVKIKNIRMTFFMFSFPAWSQGSPGKLCMLMSGHDVVFAACVPVIVAVAGP